MTRAAASIAAHDRAQPRPRRESPPRVSVVVVVYMTGAALGESLAWALKDAGVHELLVVDNGSTAEDLLYLRQLAERDERVVLLTGQGNIGFARAANLGARTATGEVLVFLNPDAFLQPDCVARLVAEIEMRPSPCVVGARVLNTDGTEQRGARRGDITPFNALLSLSGLARQRALKRFEVHWEGERLPDAAVEVPTISGACFCMRREDFDAVKGFDEKYFLHVEDVDLCWRVRKAGGEVLFHPKAEVVHLGHTSHVSPLRVEFHKGVGLARYFRKRSTGAGWLAAWALSPLVVAAAVVRPLLWRLRGRSG
jgi:GT2 family glycosyltransferase